MENNSLKLSNDLKTEVLCIVDRIKNTNSRKKAYTTLLGIKAFEEFLKDNGITGADRSDCCSINPVLLGEFNIADIKVNGIKIDIQVAVGDEYPHMSIPRNYLIYDFTPNIYVGIKLDKDADNAEFVGFIESAKVNNSSGNKNYIIVESSDLKPISEFEQVLGSFEINPKHFLAGDHDKAKELFLSYLDNEISNADKEYLVRHLANCDECIQDFNTLYNMNRIFSQAAKDSEIKEVFAENCKEYEEISSDGNGELLKDALIAGTAAAVTGTAVAAAGAMAANSINNAVTDELLDTVPRSIGLFGKIKNFFSKKDKNPLSASDIKEETDDISSLAKEVNNFDDEQPENSDNITDYTRDAQETSLNAEYPDVSDSQEINQDYTYNQLELENDFSSDDSELLDTDTETDENDISDNDYELTDTDIEEDKQPVVESDISNNNFELTDTDIEEDQSVQETDLSDNNFELTDTDIEEDKQPVLGSDISDNNFELTDTGTEEDKQPVVESDISDNDFELTNTDIEEDKPMQETVLADNNFELTDTGTDTEELPALENNISDNNFELTDTGVDAEQLNPESDIPDNNYELLDTGINIDQPDIPDNDSRLPDINIETDIKQENNSDQTNKENKEPQNLAEEVSFEYVDISELYNIVNHTDHQDDPQQVSSDQDNNITEETTSESSYHSNFAQPSEQSYEQFAEKANKNNDLEFYNDDDQEEMEQASLNIDNIDNVETFEDPEDIGVDTEQDNIADTGTVKKDVSLLKVAVIAAVTVSASIAGYVYWTNTHQLPKAAQSVQNTQNTAAQAPPASNTTANQEQSVPAKPDKPAPIKPIKPYVKKAEKINQNNINEDIVKALVTQGGPVKITNISWEISATLAANPTLKNYLMVTGQALKSALSTNLTLATDRITNNVVKVQITLDLQGNIVDSKIKISSGSNQVDKIVLQTLKNTLSYTKLPSIQTNKKLIKVGLIVNL